MTQKLPPTFTRSPSLPGYVGNAQGRYHYFTCEQANASEIASIRSQADPGSVSVTGDTDGCRITWRETTWVPAPGAGARIMSAPTMMANSNSDKKPHWTTEGGVDPGATCDVCDLPMEPIEPIPFDPGVDPVPVEPTPVDPAPVDPVPVDPVPVDPVPVDPTPTDPVPTGPSDPAPTGPTEPVPTGPSDPAPTGPSDPAPSEPEPEPEPTAPTPPPMVPVVKNFDQPLGNPACEETCPEDGSTPWNLCPRY